MRWTHVVWDPLPGGNVEHVEQNDLTTDDIDHVLEHFTFEDRSRSTARPCVFGYIADGRYILVIYEEVGDVVIPVTAYEVDEP